MITILISVILRKEWGAFENTYKEVCRARVGKLESVTNSALACFRMA